MGGSAGTSKSTQNNQQQYAQQNDQSQSENQNSQVNPWAPTQGILQNILTGLGSQQYAPTGAESGALSSIMGNAQGAHSYGGQASGLANDLMSGGGASQNGGILSDAYTRYQNQLNPIANQNNDPTQAPGMANVLSTIRNDVGNNINGLFAGAGRDLSPMHAQSLARGISQGEAVPLLNQYNQNVQNQMGAAGSLYGAGGATASGMQGFNQQGFENRGQGIDYAQSAIPMAQNNQANQILQAQAQSRGLNLGNLGGILGMALPIAGLGQSSSGTSTGTSRGNMTGNGISNTQGTQTASPLQQALMMTQMAGNLFGGPSGGAAGGFMRFLSDRRTKDDVVQIGKLYDGTPVYRFRYKGDPRVSVGLMADDVERFAPEAIAEVGGVKLVDYGAATKRAAEMGAR